MFTRVLQSLAIFTVVFSLSSCGGGGGGTPVPDLTVVPTSVSFTASSNGTLPTSQDLTISWSSSNVAVVLAGYPPSTTPPTWLNMTLTGSSSPLTLALSINTTALTPGTYGTTVRVVTGDSKAQVIDIVDIPLSYTVQGPADASPKTLHFSMNEGASLPANQSVTLKIGTLTMTPTAVTVPPADNWLSASISGNDIVFNLTSNASSLTPGFYQSTTTVNYLGAVYDISVPITLSVNKKQVNYVNPYVGYTSVAGDAIIRGHGFSDLTSPGVKFGTNSATYVTVVSDSELRVGYPALAAGAYSVEVKDAVTTLPSIAELQIVDPPSYSATSITRTGGVRMLRYDPLRKVIYVVGPVLERYAFNGASWDSSSMSLGTYGNFITLSNNYDKLIKLNQNSFTIIDPATFIANSTVNFTGLYNGSSPRSVSFANDGQAIFNTSTFPSPGSIGSTVCAYDFFNDGIHSLSDIALNGSVGAELTSTQDGSKVYLNMNVYNYPASIYDASSGVLNETATMTHGAYYGVSVDQKGTRLITSDTTNNEVVVYDGSLTALGNLPALSGIQASLQKTAFAVSPDGTRAYAYVGDTQSLYVYDLTTSDGMGGFVQIGSTTVVSGGPTYLTWMIISPDGGTLFIAGNDTLIVQPVP